MRIPKRLYCKYCYKRVAVEPGDGIIICSECGAGLRLKEINKNPRKNESTD